MPSKLPPPRGWKRRVREGVERPHWSSSGILRGRTMRPMVRVSNIGRAAWWRTADRITYIP